MSIEKHKQGQFLSMSRVFNYLMIVSIMLVICILSLLCLNYLRVNRHIARIETLSESRINLKSTDPSQQGFYIPQLPEKKLNNFPTQVQQNKKIVYHKNYKLTRDTFTNRIPVFDEVLKNFKNKPNLRYLEVGVYEGGSLVWILENVLTSPSSQAIAIDTFRDSTESNFNNNIKLSGKRKQVKLIKGYSQEKLRYLPLNTFDIIYIDGSHSASDVLEDAILSMRLLKSGGILIFDDYGHGYHHPYIEVAPAIDVFYKLYGKKFKLIQTDWLVIFEKV